MKRFAPLILIADDNDDSRALLKTLLELRGCQVVEAKDGAEALLRAESSSPDLIFLDVRMPRLDGFETAQAIRRSAKSNGAPIVFLSGGVEEIYRDRIGAAGADAYLVKPLDFDLLDKTLAAFVDAQQQRAPNRV